MPALLGSRSTLVGSRVPSESVSLPVMLKVTACPLLVLAVSFVATGVSLTVTLIMASFDTPPSLSSTV